ncbi:unnamed protein product, partial [Thlaspi arvense]
MIVRIENGMSSLYELSCLWKSVVHFEEFYSYWKFNPSPSSPSPFPSTPFSHATLCSRALKDDAHKAKLFLRGLANPPLTKTDSKQAAHTLDMVIIERILFKRAHTAEFQVVTWISLNCRPMAMFAEDQTLADVIFSDCLED